MSRAERGGRPEGAAPTELRIEISPGELFDRITILEIKAERLRDEVQLSHVRSELAALAAVRDGTFQAMTGVEQIVDELKRVNAQLWQVEDDIRDCEARQDFGAPFVALARSIYQLNDRRAVLKRAISEHFGSRIIEEKSYRGYGRSIP